MIEKLLWDDDIVLFRRMDTEAKTPAESEFFTKIRKKQESEYTYSNDLILHENDNEDNIFIVRCRYDEYEVGKPGCGSQHYMYLSLALNDNLRRLGFLDRDITLLRWLQERDYKGIRYNGNYDFR